MALKSHFFCHILDSEILKVVLCKVKFYKGFHAKHGCQLVLTTNIVVCDIFHEAKQDPSIWNTVVPFDSNVYFINCCFQVQIVIRINNFKLLNPFDTEPMAKIAVK